MFRLLRSGGSLVLLLVLVLGAVAPALAQGAPTAPTTGTEALNDANLLVSNLIRTVAYLGGLCALGYLCVKVLGPRLSPVGGKSTDLIKVVDMKRLDPQTTLYIVEAGGRHALISAGPGGVHALSKLELDDELIREQAKAREAEKAAAPKIPFASVLARSKS